MLLSSHLGPLAARPCVGRVAALTSPAPLPGRLPLPTLLLLNGQGSGLPHQSLPGYSKLNGRGKLLSGTGMGAGELGLGKGTLGWNPHPGCLCLQVNQRNSEPHTALAAPWPGLRDLGGRPGLAWMFHGDKPHPRSITCRLVPRCWAAGTDK